MRPRHDDADATAPDPDLRRRAYGERTPDPVPDLVPDLVPDPTPTEELPPTPQIMILLPANAAVGDPSFVLRVVGSAFNATSVIVFAGQEEPTNFVTDEELTTGVNMPLWQGPDPAIPVLVRTDGKDSNVVFFVLVPPREVPLDPAYASQPVPHVDQI